MDQGNAYFSAIPNEDEMFAALRQIPNQKTPGLDGMTALFYRHYWIIIKREVIVVTKISFKMVNS